MTDIIGGIWGIMRTVVISAFVLGAVLVAAVAFVAGRESGRRQPEPDTGWRTVQEGRICDCATNGLYRIQIKEN